MGLEHPSLRKKDITFSQCLHCWSKLRLEATAFVLSFAFFPTTTQFLIKLLFKISPSENQCVFPRKERIHDGHRKQF